ncbi:hypothetical protein [Streptomyces sp. WAC01280]|uniref:hypothetical protein n=1 Tax=Streptomyces sp. WAC01280 TaxID=2487424 RepID=UPI00163D0B71|nr:hypothetical protein [Streptomyces sp. WAC01280]
MQSIHRPRATEQTRPIHRAKHWTARRSADLLSSALRGAAYATGAGLVGLAFYLIQQQL